MIIVNEEFRKKTSTLSTGSELGLRDFIMWTDVISYRFLGRKTSQFAFNHFYKIIIHNDTIA